jgi:hypothetical protein
MRELWGGHGCALSNQLATFLEIQTFLPQNLAKRLCALERNFRTLIKERNYLLHSKTFADIETGENRLAYFTFKSGKNLRLWDSPQIISMANRFEDATIDAETFIREFAEFSKQ